MQITGSKLLPSLLGRFTKTVYGEHPIFQFDLPSTVTDAHLPDALHAFPVNTWKNRAKRGFFYSAPIVFASRSQLSDDVEQLALSLSLSDLLQQLLSIQSSTVRYNFVILGDRLIVTRVPHTRHISYHLLCKHITLAKRSTDVRFAGELWCDEHNCFRLNNNSGTYRPPNALIEKAAELLNELAPSLQVKGVTFEESTRPAVLQRFTVKVKRKVFLKQ